MGFNFVFNTPIQSQDFVRVAKRKDTIIFKESTVEALVSRHPWDAKKVFVTGAGHLRE